METGTFDRRVEPRRNKPEVVDNIGHVAVVYIGGAQRFFIRDSEAGAAEVSVNQVPKVPLPKDMPNFDYVLKQEN